MKNYYRIVFILFTLTISTAICFGQPAKIDEAKMMRLLEQAKVKVAEARQFVDTGEFAKAADSYTAALTPFDNLSNPEEIALSADTLISLHRLRAAVYVGAKKNDLADADYRKVGKMYMIQAQEYVKKRKTKAANDPFMAMDYLQRALDLVVKAFGVEKTRIAAYETAKIPLDAKSQALFSPEEIKEDGGVMKEILLDWAGLETARFLQVNHPENAESALEKLNTVIKIAPNETEAYKLRAKIYRKQNKTDLALADENKVKELKP